MIRDIKFRAWDGERMFVPTSIPNGRPSEDHLGGSVMQYTGLKDKNGREIYEGDILSPFRITRNDGPFVVRFTDKGAYGDIGGGFCCRNEHGVLILVHSWDTREVIGNIYENPELLS